MQIVKVTIADISLVAPLFDQYRVFYDKPSDLDLAHSFIEARIKHRESVIFLAINAEGEAVGFTQLYPNFSSVSAVRTWILNDLYVIDKLRGQGTGKQLLNTARDYAISTGAKGISLETAPDNIGAQKLYESLGYKREMDYYHYSLSL
ncbi:N-acetyltransferase family protein [uncultured Psychrobacter sp.]|uniref:GNAT family N-acetyltransferase n=1 Tax=uncultured Psychrobacter sp. TaxID=259303 RepID=UPI0034580409